MPPQNNMFWNGPSGPTIANANGGFMDLAAMMQAAGTGTDIPEIGMANPYGQLMGGAMQQQPQVGTLQQLQEAVADVEEAAPAGPIAANGNVDAQGGGGGGIANQQNPAALDNWMGGWFNTGQSAGHQSFGDAIDRPGFGYVGGHMPQIPGGMSNPYTPYGQQQLLQGAADATGQIIGDQLNQNAYVNYMNDKARANYELMDKLIDTIGNFDFGVGGGGGSGGMKGFYDTQSRQAAALPGVHQTDIDTSPVSSVGEAVAKAYGTPAPAPGTNGSLPGVSSKATAALNRQYNDANAAAGSANALATEVAGRRQNANLVRGAQQARAAQGLDNARFMSNLHGQNTRNNLARMGNQVAAQGARNSLISPLFQALSRGLA